MRGYTSAHPLFDRPATEGPATNLELGLICQRFGARLHELKVAGHPWVKRTIRAGVYEYRLIG